MKKNYGSFLSDYDGLNHNGNENMLYEKKWKYRKDILGYHIFCDQRMQMEKNGEIKISQP